MYEHERSLVERLNGEPFALVGVNTDTEIRRFQRAASNNQLSWRSFYDGSEGPIVKQYGVTSFPTILVLDRDGRIRFTQVDGDRLDDAVDRLLAEMKSRESVGDSNSPIE